MDLSALRFSESEGYVEYSADGRVLKVRKRLHEKSKYEEDVLLGSHTSVWGSYFDVSIGSWGFKCCKRCVPNFDCMSIERSQERAPHIYGSPAGPEAASSPDTCVRDMGHSVIGSCEAHSKMQDARHKQGNARRTTSRCASIVKSGSLK